ncbi:alpha/beta fold hydrolase [Ideonella azotifigens]|uniref:Alpha/beta fold hydrolase n=2 Tax=Ideonella azotifigens TaxID=513160 RepID=A0ABN1JR10_9BURK|nr:alpha/beta fold hydrolase [Ideonella azotifigens]MCD2340147.1 alpha/beta fold hydrolase [Ideonella azotifigens]
MPTPAPLARPELPSLAERIDPLVHAALARGSASLSLASPLLAWLDWSLHLAASPGKRADLGSLAWQQAQQWTHYALACGAAAGRAPAEGCCVAPPAHDRRFEAPEWQRWPFNLMHQSFLLTEQWWAAATQGVWGVEKHHQDLVAFGARQLLDLASPGNQLLTNPVVLERTQAQLGANLARGFLNAVEDLQREAVHAPPAGTEPFQVGRNLAVTPGKVVLKNRLMELIQYAPSTPTVHPEPVLIVPAWIMKYYILDLSPHNSLIKFLVDQGRTVFCISWKNPQAEDRELGMDDYLSLGVAAALAAVRDIVPKQPVHAVGYCLGGTLLSMAAAALARTEPEALASMTLFAAQTDFHEPGELGLFIDENQVSLLEAQMARTGYLKASQMAGAFQMLRSNDLLWSRLINEYLLGQRATMNDLMAWNADATRMPARMHSQYLRQLFLKNDLAEGRFMVDGHPVSLADLRLPVFMVGTLTDHVAPWRSVYKLHHLCPAEITFALTSGGHNAGIVNPPGAGHRRHQLLTRPAEGPSLTADDWLAAAPQHEGSWWPAWQAWLAAHSGAPVKPPHMGGRHKGALADAPGSYVMVR